MGNPTEGVVAAGDPSTAVAPIILAGVDTDGTVRSLAVDADGVLQTNGASTPSLAAVVAVGNSANSHKITSLTAASAAGDAVAVDATALGVLADSANGGTKPELTNPTDAQDIADALIALGLVTQAAP